jgi:energy-coupling factor transport system substrate-specific component
MFTIGWVGLTSAWLSKVRRIEWVRRHAWIEVAVLCVWGLVWGMAFGLVMNVWFWPFVFEPSQGDMYWESSLRPLEAIKRYLLFYVFTSSWWDVGRAVGTALIIALFGAPVLKLLRRFGSRFTFQTDPER